MYPAVKIMPAFLAPLQDNVSHNLNFFKRVFRV